MPKPIKTPVADFWTTSSRRRSVVIEKVCGYHQLDNYSCGAAAVATVVRAYSGKLDAAYWFTTLQYTNPDPQGGTPTRRLRRALHELGFKSTIKRSFNAANVSEAIRQGDLMITTVRMPRQRANETHWVVVAGCSPEDVLILNATGLPLFSKRWIPWDDARSRRDPRECVIQVHTGLTPWVSDRYPVKASGNRSKSLIARMK